jgi:hypothetical protein
MSVTHGLQPDIPGPTRRDIYMLPRVPQDMRPEKSGAFAEAIRLTLLTALVAALWICGGAFIVLLFA